MGLFNDIPLRENGQRIVYSWFNALRTAGLFLENALGAGAIIDTTFTMTNGASAANVTGLLFSSSTVRSAIVEYYAYRYTTGGGGQELIESGILLINYKPVATTWDIQKIAYVGDASIDFGISAGQVTYTLNTMTGTNSAQTLHFSARTLGV